MSGKMFWQIVLLIIIAAFSFGIADLCVKVAAWKCRPGICRPMMEKGAMQEGGRMMRQREEK